MNKRKLIEQLRTVWMRYSLWLITLLPVLIAAILVYKSVPLLLEDGLKAVFGMDWSPIKGQFGMLNFIVSSLLVTLLGLLIALPFCLATAVFISEFLPPKISKVIRSYIDVLSGLPSVLFGLWGVLCVVPFVGEVAKYFGVENQSGYSLLAASIVVAISVVPYILNMIIELMETVSKDLREAAYSLGASHWEVIYDVVLKRIKAGIVASFALGTSKAFGETIAVLMVVGNVIQIPKSIFDSAYPLPALIANNYGEMMSIPKYDSALMLSALLLLIIVFTFNYYSHKLIRYYKKQQ
jgi:phosphate transport system permease protein